MDIKKVWVWLHKVLKLSGLYSDNPERDNVFAQGCSHSFEGFSHQSVGNTLQSTPGGSVFQSFALTQRAHPEKQARRIELMGEKSYATEGVPGGNLRAGYGEAGSYRIGTKMYNPLILLGETRSGTWAPLDWALAQGLQNPDVGNEIGGLQGER